MKVKILKSIEHFSLGYLEANQIIEVPEEVGKNLVKYGYASASEEKGSSKKAENGSV